MGVMNTAPKGELTLDDVTVTSAQLRQREAFLAARHSTRWVAYVRALRSRTLAGYTEMTWNPANARVLSQGDTGVQPNFRGHGLGKWLKAAMLERALSEKPAVRHVRTGNADANAPMLKINHALGFRLRMAEVVWQVERVTLHAYLQKRI